jgi:hypothetical protein
MPQGYAQPGAKCHSVRVDALRWTNPSRSSRMTPVEGCPRNPRLVLVPLFWTDSHHGQAPIIWLAQASKLGGRSLPELARP